MKDVVEALIAGRALLVQGFTWGTHARNADAERVHFNSEDAVCWCSSGALLRVTKSSPTGVYWACRSELNIAVSEVEPEHQKDPIYQSPFVSYNDTHSKEEVLALWDHAIANAKGREGV